MTLIEAIVAFVIAALSLGVLFQAGGNGIGAVRTAGRYEEAVSRAESHLAAIGPGTPLAAVAQQGDDGGGYHWALQIAPMRAVSYVNRDPTGLGPTNRQATLFAVGVDISWQEGDRTRHVRLETERVGAAPISP